MRNTILGVALFLQVLMEEPGDGGGGGNGGGNGGGGGKTFTQEDVNRIIAERLVEERKRGNIKPEEKEELQRLKDEAAARKVKDDEAAANYEAAKQSLTQSYEDKLKAKDQVLGSLTGRLHNLTIVQQIEAVASPLANDSTEISALLRDRVKLNDQFEPVVYGVDGKPAFVNGEPMTIQQMVTGYLAQPNKKHLLRATQQKPAGAGDGEGAGDEAGANAPEDEKKLAAAKKKYDDAFKTAQRSGNASDITASLTAKRAYDDIAAEIKRKKGN